MNVEHATDVLKSVLSPGDTLTCIRVNHGRQGRRHIAVLFHGALYPSDKPKIQDITAFVSVVVGSKRALDGGIPCQDAGHDLIALLCLRLGWKYDALKVQAFY